MLSLVPQVGRVGQVILNDIPLMLVPGSYRVQPAERFADKISTGGLKYADFRPYETPWEASSFAAGYGLQRYSDLEAGNPLRREMYLESEGIDCREDGVAILGPKVEASATTLNGEPIWIGEFTPSTGALSGVAQLVVATSTGRVYTVNSDMTLTLRVTLPNNPLPAAIGVMGGHLLLGYGVDRVAQYTNDLATLTNIANLTPSDIYIWAVTTDRASAYVAGGPNPTDWNKVVSSQTGIDAYSAPINEVVCSSSASKIVELAPGGGIVLVFVGKEDELGAIDADAVYRSLVPFDSKLATNNGFLRWWLSGASGEQRGPVVLFFPRDQALWSYQPQSDTAGTAKNMSPWASTGIRPPNIRGRSTALQGTARWLYYAITSARLGEYWILAQDARTGAVHSLMALGTNACRSIALSSLIGASPRLFYGYGSKIASTSLPLDGDSPLGNPACRFELSGILDLPDIDLDFPDEQKILFAVRIIADNLLPAARTVSVSASYDGGAYQSLGTAEVSPMSELEFPASTSVRRVGLRLEFSSTSDQETPQLRAVVLRASINPKMYRIWEFQAKLPPGSMSSMTDDLQSPLATLNTLWDAHEAGLPVGYADRWGDPWTVRILGMIEQEVLREPDRTLESVLGIQLLQVQRDSAGTLVWDAFSWDESTALYG